MPTEPKLDGVVVLVVDDNADSRAVLSQILEGHGARVLLAESAKTALQILAEHAPNVLVSDIAMPGMDGIDLIEEIRSRERLKKLTQNVDTHLPAVAVTALRSEEDQRKCIKAGFHVHFPKPIDFTVLIKTVASLATGTHSSS